METQKTPSSQSGPEKEEWSWRSPLLTSGCPTELPSSGQCGAGAGQKYRPMEQDRRPRDKLTHLWVPYF